MTSHPAHYSLGAPAEPGGGDPLHLHGHHQLGVHQEQQSRLRQAQKFNSLL